MKGIALPMNYLVIIIIGIVVLVAVSVMFMGFFAEGQEDLKLEEELSKKCNLFVISGGCDIGGDPDDFSISDSSFQNINTLTDLCAQRGILSKADCKDKCCGK
ncbi:MAG: hypothetical protein GOV02_00925 [Candidatus Aenigmarchaeota archaeon]|nr:hypothetical protein [Candidatus Aenigmarchaeota archaeon]